MSIEGLEQRQSAIYLVAIGTAFAVGAWAPSIGESLEVLIYPVLGALLLVTFLQVPFGRIADSSKNFGFLARLMVINFLFVPPVAWGLSLTADQPAIQLGLLLVLLVPCIDYVIVFTKMAGGDESALLASTPLLMLVQILLLPLFVWLFMGSELAGLIKAGPFVMTFLLLIVLPLGLAWAFQAASRGSSKARSSIEASNLLPVPLMAATLFVVVASQSPTVIDDFGPVAATIPVFLVFIALMTAIGTMMSRVGSTKDPGIQRAVLLSGVTRNGLVVLPLALALDVDGSITAAVIVTQVLVEVTVLVFLVKLVPRLIPLR